ncbi:Fanconi anemia group M protein [Daktulosphaira vitifoliae]|uniref:Fanconi anemia group M protein n=1 Tax=Daktulosphaira vitifoliae TaxID=58002 RepID=UPI0021A9A87B|nr:Fanconi anemia group M protein [Daktulosphaira vitifoliae]XP_050531447.1 Fanconi anemia group M protein [Daktulosphaira vitifoliae]XP_050531449.1 Fanconi anemia group M protein [Daktulosphaira vitifoliae]
MEEVFDDFSSNDDDILASVLEESIRHYNEVELPLRSITYQPKSGFSNFTEDIENPVIDLCSSPKKHSMVQSRLSNFFVKPTNYNEEVTNELQKIDSCIKPEDKEANNYDRKTTIDSIDVNDIISSSPAIFYRGSDAEGFHLSSGSHFVYPSNFPVREYQMSIIKTALFHNTLVSLPTGMGKTFIAAVVMYNFYRWYPTGKIVFMAPTRPLVAQQIEACHTIMGIPRDVTFEMTGSIPPEQRYLAWKKYRVFFLTPQVMANDMAINKCPTDLLKCIVIDEAHRATKDYAYVQVLKGLQVQNRLVRIIGLSATPGTTVDAVTEVIQNLNTSKLEYRTEESLDVVKYLNKKDVECIAVKLTDSILNIRSSFLMVYDKYSRRLKQYNALNGNVTNLTKFQVLGAKQKFQASNMAREMPKALVGCLINDFTICMSLAYALELLTTYGIKVFYLQLLELLECHKCLTSDSEVGKLMHEINIELNKQDLTWSHPKLYELKKIVLNYFNMENADANSKIIIFCQYRLVVVEVFELLKSFGEPIKPVMFVGQSLKEKGGLCQKKQLEVMVRFKNGDFNVLIATSVAEEGLDIGEVDLIICLEANRSPIKFVQRLGRTGRKRSGKCITLLTEGKEHVKYKSSVSSSKTLVTKLLKNKVVLSKLGQGGPRLIPNNIDPKLLMVHIKKTEEIIPENKKRRSKRKADLIENDDDNNEIKDKIKKKSKKRKITDSESPKQKNIGINNNNKLDAEDNFFISNKKDDTVISIDDNVLKKKIDLLSSNEAVFDYLPSVEISADDMSDTFSKELKVFNEWEQSCENANSVLVNELFFKVLNVFTEPCEDVQTENETIFLNDKCQKVQNKVNGITKSVFETRNHTQYDLSMNMSTEKNNLFIESINKDDNRAKILSMDSDIINYKDIKMSTFNKTQDNIIENSKLIDFKDLFKTQNSIEQNNDNIKLNDKNFGEYSTHLKFTQRSPLINSSYRLNEMRTDISDFNNDFFKNQNVSNEIEKKIPESFNDSNTLDLISIQNSPIVSSSKNSNIFENLSISSDSNSDSENKLVKKINFDEFFKSQRANRYIEDYMEKITELPKEVEKNIDGNSYKSFILNDDKESCSIISNDAISNANEKLVEKEGLIDLCESQSSSSCYKIDGNIFSNKKLHSGSLKNSTVCNEYSSSVLKEEQFPKTSNKPIDFKQFFKSQRSNKYIENYTEKITEPSKEVEKNINGNSYKSFILNDDKESCSIISNDAISNANEKLVEKVELIDLCESQSSSSLKNSTDCHKYSSSVLKKEQFPKMSNKPIDFEQVFKSHMTSSFIEDNMERESQSNKQTNALENSKNIYVVDNNETTNEVMDKINFVGLSENHEYNFDSNEKTNTSNNTSIKNLKNINKQSNSILNFETSYNCNYYDESSKRSNKNIDFDELFNKTPNKFINYYLTSSDNPKKKFITNDNILKSLDSCDEYNSTNIQNNVMKTNDSPVFSKIKIKKSATCIDTKFVDTTSPDFSKKISSPNCASTLPQVNHNIVNLPEEIHDDFWANSSKMYKKNGMDFNFEINNDIKSCSNSSFENHINKFKDNNSVDSDDMDFMFIDYKSSNIEQYALSQKSKSLSLCSSHENNEVEKLITSNLDKVDNTLTSVSKLPSISSPFMCMHSGFAKKKQDYVSNTTSNKKHVEQNNNPNNKPSETGRISFNNEMKLLEKSPIIKSNTQPFKIQSTQPISGLPFNSNLELLKTCNLLKPGFSLKRNASKTMKAPSITPSINVPQQTDVSPIQPKRSYTRTQSTPKVPLTQNKPVNFEIPINIKNDLTTQTFKSLDNYCKPTKVPSSSDEDSDVFINDQSESSIETKQIYFKYTNKNKKKPKKKLVFIDDEAEESSDCADLKTSDEESHEYDNFDSSFIDDLDKTDVASISMTKQYLQSVKSPAVNRGVFKIPQLTTKHYNMDVYSQAVEKNDSNYLEDSFCVQDTSDIYTSSSTSGAHQTNEECPLPPLRSFKCRPEKRKRILSPQKSDSDDSPDQFHKKNLHKRIRINNILDSS